MKFEILCVRNHTIANCFKAMNALFLVNYYCWYSYDIPASAVSFFLQGELPHDQDVVEYIMNQPNVVPRINSRILTAKREYLDLTASSKEHFSNDSAFDLCLTCFCLLDYNAKMVDHNYDICFWTHRKFLIKKDKFWGWREGSVIKNACCFCRRLGFETQLPLLTSKGTDTYVHATKTLLHIK